METKIIDSTHESSERNIINTKNLIILNKYKINEAEVGDTYEVIVLLLEKLMKI